MSITILSLEGTCSHSGCYRGAQGSIKCCCVLVRSGLPGVLARQAHFWVPPMGRSHTRVRILRVSVRARVRIFRWLYCLVVRIFSLPADSCVCVFTAPIRLKLREGPTRKNQDASIDANAPHVVANNTHSYNCRHNSRLSGDANFVGCRGTVQISSDERRRHHDVVCKLCSKYCGCGRLDCGLEACSGELCRVVSGVVQPDERWCKEERRWAAIEEEDRDDY